MDKFWGIRHVNLTWDNIIECIINLLNFFINTCGGEHICLCKCAFECEYMFM